VVLFSTMKDWMMRHATTDVVGMKTRSPSLLAVTPVDETAAQASPPSLFVPYEERIAVLMVIPEGAVPAEIVVHLDASGYEVWTASNGRAAVELAEQSPPDIILLDLDGMYEINHMVKVSGFRVLHLLGRLKRGHPVAVVVMTALDYTEVEGPVRASADDFINKPIEPAQLLCRLQGALDRVRNRHQQHRITVAPAWEA
jgi:DNA-binding response OmpR family regulator